MAYEFGLVFNFSVSRLLSFSASRLLGVSAGDKQATSRRQAGDMQAASRRQDGGARRVGGNVHRGINGKEGKRTCESKAGFSMSELMNTQMWLLICHALVLAHSSSLHASQDMAPAAPT